ncbi:MULTISPECIES: zinc-binding dehydrogenase [unclassified Leucobacter]|uniref:zinc-dependent alcohol dehydrogenase n=1 Tax=unclassified Leucobacter TaxID=2621730 RepID=UPI00165DBFCB|nr:MULTISPECIES: alcohol dehydrogenase catalytic domain-containing protein [unclassified Leucobacter]MBC9937195.1 alcohol dehydrogenase catalytic domain-containing protein [Leucobacter sp. cx-87]
MPQPYHLPATASQVVFPAAGVVEFGRKPVPAPGPDDVLVRVALVGVCATDLHLLAGHIGDPFPLVPGHEFVGVVAALGAAAARDRRLAVGDRVAVEMLLPCGRCPRCREGRYNLCDLDDGAAGLPRGRQMGVNIPRTVAPGLWGGYSDVLFVPREAIVHRLPEGLEWNRAVLTEPLAVAYRALTRGRVRAGDTVAVVGPGPVGLLVAAAAADAGAARVAMIGTRSERLALALELGADTVINSRETDPVAALHDAFGGGADVVIEMAGVTSAQQQAVRLARRGGRVVLAGACGAAAPVTFLADEDLLTREIDLLPSFLSAGGFEPAIAFLGRSTLPVERIVTHRFALEDTEAAFVTVSERADGALKVVLVPGDPPEDW